MKRRECVLLNICGLFLYFSFSSAGAIERYDFELCGTEDVVSQNCEYHEQVAKKFWEYAIMAADTYRAIDSIEWKKRRVRNIFRNKDGAEKSNLYTNDFSNEADSSKKDEWDEYASIVYGSKDYCPTEIANLTEADCEGHECKFDSTYPPKSESNVGEACKSDEKAKSVPEPPKLKGVSVPIKINSWVRLFDFDRHPPAKGFRVFVPGFYVEVWVKDYVKSDENPEPYVEYAIVFRGTQGGGGWFSNLRYITGLIPIFHDQYKQAKSIFPRIMDQIELREREFNKQGEKRERKITLVGHSLGAGLALYVAFNNKGVTKIIGFNPSLITGASFVPQETIKTNLENVKEVDFIYENSEILHFFESCKEGDLLNENNPNLKIGCYKVNLLGGTIFNQHDMGPMACRLTVINNSILKKKNRISE